MSSDKGPRDNLCLSVFVSWRWQGLRIKFPSFNSNIMIILTPDTINIGRKGK